MFDLIWKNCACNKENFEPDRLSVEETEELINKMKAHFTDAHHLSQDEIDELRKELEDGKFSEEEINRLRIRWNIKKSKAKGKARAKDAKMHASINRKENKIKREADIKRAKAQYKLNQKKEQ